MTRTTVLEVLEQVLTLGNARALANAAAALDARRTEEEAVAALVARLEGAGARSAA